MINGINGEQTVLCGNKEVKITINAQNSIKFTGDKTVYFDPFMVTKEENDADIIFITHEHFDHYSPDDIRKVMKKDTIMVAPASMKEQVIGDYGKILEDIRFVDANERDKELLIDDISVKWVRAYNVGKPFHKKESDWVSYLVKLEGKTFFVMGDTDANEDNAGIKCDVLLIPCGGKYTFDAKEAAAYTASINPPFAIPTHYGKTEIAGEYVEELYRLNDKIKTEILF